jgi:hypothetical protein
MKDLKMYINGKFVESRSGEWIEVLNPSTEEVTSRQPAGTVEDVEEAVNAAYEAQKKWAPQFQDIHISRVVCRGCKTGIKAAGVTGLECVKNITISDCSFVYNKTDKDIDDATARLTLTNVKFAKP